MSRLPSQGEARRLQEESAAQRRALEKRQALLATGRSVISPQAALFHMKTIRMKQSDLQENDFNGPGLHHLPGGQRALRPQRPEDEARRHVGNGLA